ncbi:conserved hypothetical protein [delta proteobacterium NaphS2]|nr:conserved hypothetical protein [delta proteobacterium NaphS2]
MSFHLLSRHTPRQPEQGKIAPPSKKSKKSDHTTCREQFLRQTTPLSIGI